MKINIENFFFVNFEEFSRSTKYQYLYIATGRKTKGLRKGE